MTQHSGKIIIAVTTLSLMGITLASAKGVNEMKGATGAAVKICVQQRKDAKEGEHPSREQRQAVRAQFRTCIRNAVMLNHGHAKSKHSQSSHSSMSSHTSSSQSMTAKVEIEDFEFYPQVLTVKQGTTVRWKNEDRAPHTITSTGTGGLNSGTLDRNEHYSYTFTGTGTYNYHCSFHPTMTGAVIVTE